MATVGSADTLNAVNERRLQTHLGFSPGHKLSRGSSAISSGQETSRTSVQKPRDSLSRRRTKRASGLDMPSARPPSLRHWAAPTAPNIVARDGWVGSPPLSRLLGHDLSRRFLCHSNIASSSLTRLFECERTKESSRRDGRPGIVSRLVPRGPTLASASHGFVASSG